MLKLNHFNKYGYAIFEGCVEEKICDLIKEKVLRSKNFDKKIFLNKEEFEKKNLMLLIKTQDLVIIW